MKRSKTIAAVGVSLGLLLAACGSDKKAADTTAAETSQISGTTVAPDTTAAAETTAPAETTAAAPAAWKVDASACADPKAAAAPIEGTIKIGTVVPLSGGPGAAFGPVADGFKAFVKHANDNNLVKGHPLELTVEDDQYNKDLTPGSVEKLIQSTGVNLFSGMVGSPNNAAVRDLLNEECYPQLNALTGSPAWGEADKYPWTTGALVPYNIEAKIYAATIKELFPSGAKVAIFAVNNEFGKVYVDSFKELAKTGGIEIVEEQTIDATDSNPPTAQLTAIAAKKPDAIMAIPLGAQCPTFLKEVVNSKAANAGWSPKVFLTNTCSSKLFLSLLAGEAGDGVYTSSNVKDVTDPANASDPGVKAFLEDYAAEGLKNDPALTAVGWVIGEITIAILNKAMENGDLSRVGIIDAARNLEFVPSLLRDGAKYKLNGLEDTFATQALQVLQWSHKDQKFAQIGAMNNSFES